MFKNSHKTKRGNRIYKRNEKSKSFTYRFTRRGKTTYMNVGRNLQVAKDMADEIEAFLVFNSLEDTLEKYSPDRGTRKVDVRIPKEPVLGDIVACLELKRKSLGIEKRTVQCYRRAIYALTSKSKTDAEKTPLSFLTRDQLTKYKESELDGITDEVAINEKKRTINSILKNAKAIFNEHTVSKMPEEWDLRGAEFLQNELYFRRVRKKYMLPNESLVKRTFELYESYKGTDPDSEVIMALGLHFGLRRAEIAATRRSWVSIDTKKAIIAVKHEEDFKPKGGVEGYTAGDLASANSMLKNAEGFDKLISDTARSCERPFQKVLKDLREIGWQRQSPLHECRKLYGSFLATTQGLYVAQSYLRHSSPAVTSQYYASLMPTDSFISMWAA